MARWCQSGNPEVVGSHPAGLNKLAVGGTFHGQIYKRFLSMATFGHTFYSTKVINWG